MQKCVLTCSKSQDDATSGRVEREREGYGLDDVPARERASSVSACMDIGAVPNWTLEEYRHKCTNVMDTKGFDARAVVDSNLLIYDLHRFKNDTTLGAVK